jgi:hypothetical protein
MGESDSMRTLLALVILAGGMLALEAAADDAVKSKRGAKSAHSDADKSRGKGERRKGDRAKSDQERKAQIVCEERARHEDPTGQYAMFPCWAREAFARGANIDMH